MPVTVHHTTSLNAKLLSIYVPLVGLAVLVLFGILELRFYREQRHILVEDLRHLVEVQTAAFSAAVWEYDTDQLQILMADTARLPYVESVTVLEASGKQLASMGYARRGIVDDDLQAEAQLVHAVGVTEEVLGELRITGHDRHIRKLVIVNVQSNALVLAVLIAALIGATLFATSRVIGRPVQALRHSIDRLRSDNVREPADWRSSDELGQVVVAFNAMLDAQAEAERRLKEYQDHLEELVAQRTEQLSKTANKLELVLANIPSGIFQISRDLEIDFINDRFAELWQLPDGLVYEGAPIQPLLRFLAQRGDLGEGDPPDLLSQWIEKLRTGSAEAHDRHLPEGRAAHVRWVPKLDGGTLVLADDITERVRAESVVRQSEAKLLEILRKSPIGVGVASAETSALAFVNDRCEDLFGYPRGSMVGAQMSKLYADQEEHHRLYAALSADGEVRDREVVMRRRGGKNLWILMSMFPVDYEGKPARLAWLYDITERKNSEQALTNAYNVISSSIQYASRIQRSMLPQPSSFEAIFDDYFVLWEPRDLVGGDIYWTRHWGDGHLLILADCTGHGVPGAFMTLIASGALDRARGDIPPGDLAGLVRRMHEIIQSVLKQHRKGGESDDGLELGACYVESHAAAMKFVGARFSLLIMDGGQVREIRGNRTGIAYRGVKSNVGLTEHVVDLTPDRRFYLFTDGIVDQIGGEKRRGFGKRRLKALLIDNQQRSLSSQKRHIKQALAIYEGTETRRDDVSMIGFRPRQQT